LSGKSTIANLLESRLDAEGRHTYLLDVDNARPGINRDLGLPVAGRVARVRRVAEVARLMVDAGLIVLVALIAPFRAERDAKGLYVKARRGELPNFTGIDSAYERPETPDVHLL